MVVELISPFVAFHSGSSGLRLAQSIRSNYHAGIRIHFEFLTPGPVLSLLTELSLAYFKVHSCSIPITPKVRYKKSSALLIFALLFDTVNT